MAQTLKRSKKKWLNFYPHCTGSSIESITVRNYKTGDDLGEIEYCNGWRQYVWYPASSIQFSAGCLQELAAFIDTRNWTKGCYKQKEVPK